MTPEQKERLEEIQKLEDWREAYRDEGCACSCLGRNAPCGYCEDMPFPPEEHEALTKEYEVLKALERGSKPSTRSTRRRKTTEVEG